ncbi:MAG: DUF4082 domain-containing protein [Patescibacteria group bacterium]
MVNFNKTKKIRFGFSLVEVILAVALFGLFATALIGLLMNSYGSNYQSAERDLATLYAQQGLEATRSIRRQAWNFLVNGDHGVSDAAGRWEFLGSVDTLGDKYTRVISISNVCRDSSSNIVDCIQAGAIVDLYTKKAVSKVLYTSINHFPNVVELATYLTDWQSKDWVQNNWLGGPGQSYWSSPVKYDSDDGNIDYQTAGQIKLAQTAGLKEQSWNFDVPTDYLYNPDKIELVGGVATLKAIGVSMSDQSQNSSFDSTTGWSFHTWSRDFNDVRPSGSRVNSGGNPGRYCRLTVPRGRNDNVGGWVERSFIVTPQNLASVKLNFDWRIEQKGAAVPDTFRLYVFIDKNVGIEPTIGSQVWASDELKSWSPIPTNWNSINDIDVSSVVTEPGTYYLKLAIWVQTPNQNSGPFVIGYDNAKVVWTWNGSGYPTDRPTIEPVSSFAANQLQSWHGFSEQASKNSGEIYYQLSNDDGSTWLYWNGTNWSNAGSSNYNTANQINVHLKDFPTDNNTLKFKAFLAATSTQPISLDSVSVYYATAEGKYWGNEFLVSQTGQTNEIDNNNKKLDFRFTAKETKPVNQIQLYQTSAATGRVRVGLSADNGSGNPSGTYLASGTFTSTGRNAWQAITISPVVSLTKDKIYHIVIQRDNNSGRRTFRYDLPKNTFWPYDNLADPNLDILWTTNGGTSWSALAQTPVFILRYTDGAYAGISYHNFITANSTWSRIYGTRQRGQQFVYSGDDLEVSGLAFYVHKREAQAPEDDLYVSLYDLSSNIEIASSTLVTAAQISQTYSWQSANFATTKKLLNGHEYRASIYSPKTSQNLAYEIYVMENANNTAANSVNFLGTDSRFGTSNNSGNTWNYYGQYDTIFRIIYFPTSTGYAPFGSFVSSAFNTGGPSSFNLISWEQTIPSCSPACQIKLQLRTAPDNQGAPGSWTPWFGPSGSGSYFINPSETLIPLDSNFNQWLQYRAELIGDSNDTPILKKVKINYTP